MDALPAVIYFVRIKGFCDPFLAKGANQSWDSGGGANQNWMAAANWGGDNPDVLPANADAVTIADGGTGSGGNAVYILSDGDLQVSRGGNSGASSASASLDVGVDGGTGLFTISGGSLETRVGENHVEKWINMVTL